MSTVLYKKLVAKLRLLVTLELRLKTRKILFVKFYNSAWTYTKTIRYEAIGCLLDGMNPTFVQKLLMKYAKVDQFDRPWTCTNNSGGIEKWLFSLGPQQWLTSLLLSEEN
ncbi:conserved hypothetical protein [Trichinella spiralis]|uniref:hypothetical protein n=1 Tax=Trichinella spiralis TaxID=6334 RepID=UPI0001EFC8AD|nr:conserved hypothetical protein [Trichinella spiralis]